MARPWHEGEAALFTGLLLYPSPASYWGCSAPYYTSSVSYLSVMATCSSMAEPVLAFQFPEMEVLLYQKNNTEGIRTAVTALFSFFALAVRRLQFKYLAHILTCIVRDTSCPQLYLPVFIFLYADCLIYLLDLMYLFLGHL